MKKNPNQPQEPQEYDVVKGGQVPPLVTAVVLGGIKGVKQRLFSGAVEHRIAALHEALKYEDAGLDLVVEVFKDLVSQENRGELRQVMWTAYALLRSRTEPQVKQVLWDYNPYPLFECLNTFSGSSGWLPPNVAITPNGQTVVCSGPDETIKILELQTGQEICTLSGHPKGTRSIGFSADGQILVSCSYRWSGAEYYDDGGNECIIQVWELPTGRKIRTFSGYGDFALTPDGQLLVSGTTYDSWNYETEQPTLKVWDVKTGQEIRTLQTHCWVDSLVISSDGQTLACGEIVDFYDWTTRMRIWDLLTGQEIHTHSEKAGWYDELKSFDFTISPDGQTILSGSLNNTLEVWGLQTGKLICTYDEVFRPKFNRRFSDPSLIAFSPDVQTLVCVGYDYLVGTIINMWDLATGREIPTFMEHKDLASIALSPNGQTILSGSYNGTIKVWGVP
jgi:WD40 repeat protein